MTLYTLSAWLNVAALLFVGAFSLAIVRRYPTPFFRAWTLAVFAAVAPSTGEALAPVVGRGLALDATVAPFGTLSAAWLADAAVRLRGGALPRWAFPAAVAGVMAWVVGAHAAGWPHPLPVLPPIFAIAAGFFFLGATMIRVGRGTDHPGLGWFGWPAIAYSLFLVNYPVFAWLDLLWLGCVLSALLILVLGVGIVVSQIETIAATTRRQNEELRRLDALKQSLLSTVAHELRTPLTVIQGNSEFLEDELCDRLTPQQAGYMAEVRRGVDELAERVCGMMDAMSLTAGTIGLKPRALAIAPVIEQAMQPLLPAIEDKALAFEVAADPALPPVMADPDGLSKVLHHLVANAVKFTHPGGRVRVRVEAFASAVRVRVSDTGMGIPPEEQARIFEPFVQVDGSLTRRHGGAGLGLAVVKRLVEKMGGEIAVESRAGEGSTFSVTLPSAPDGAHQRAR